MRKILGSNRDSISVGDNTRRIRPIRISDGRPNGEDATKNDLTQLRSVVGSLSWVARQGRPDLLYVVSRLQSEVKGATVQTLRDANKAVQMAQAGRDEVYVNFPLKLMEWKDVRVCLSQTPRSQTNQGRSPSKVDVNSWHLSDS